MASSQEDAFREIQLSGKQIVFLFMAVVVIAVAIFLMGVQVGRGVLTERGLPEGTDTLAAADVEPPPPPASATRGSSSAPVTSGEKLSYAERLGGAEPAPEQLRKAEAPVAPAEPPTPKPEAPGATSGGEGGEPPGPGYSVQVAALRERNEADLIAKRLAGKGYPAYVVAPAKGAPSVYRVRVGKYRDRREADTVAARLQKEEQFKPWIVR
jgi:cell division septation protein DedD